MPRKSKILKSLKIPLTYFPDFLRGCIDGDGSISLADHPESKHKQLRLRLCSASLPFMLWIMNKIKVRVKCKGGWVYTPKKKIVYSLCFGKEDSIKIIKYMYYDGVGYYLNRKYTLTKEYLGE